MMTNTLKAVPRFTHAQFQVVDAGIVVPSGELTAGHIEAHDALFRLDAGRLVNGNIKGDARRRWSERITGRTLYGGLLSPGEPDSPDVDVMFTAARYNPAQVRDLGSVGLMISVGTASIDGFTPHPDVPEDFASAVYEAAPLLSNLRG